MFRPVRRKKNEIDLDEAQALLRTERRGVLAMHGDGGYPYAIPLNFLYDEAQGRIYFHGAAAGHKADALRADDRVCFTVYGHETVKKETWAPFLQSAVVFGRCRILEERGETQTLVKRLAMKYFPDEQTADEEIAASGKAVRIYVLDIEHISGKEIQER